MLVQVNKPVFMSAQSGIEAKIGLKPVSALALIESGAKISSQGSLGKFK